MELEICYGLNNVVKREVDVTRKRANVRIDSPFDTTIMEFEQKADGCERLLCISQVALPVGNEVLDENKRRRYIIPSGYLEIAIAICKYMDVPSNENDNSKYTMKFGDTKFTAYYRSISIDYYDEPYIMPVVDIELLNRSDPDDLTTSITIYDVIDQIPIMRGFFGISESTTPYVLANEIDRIGKTNYSENCDSEQMKELTALLNVGFVFDERLFEKPIYKKPIEE